MAIDENEPVFASSPPYNPPSSPPPCPSSGLKSTKPKKPPPITPKRFTRFFTPRTSSTQSSRGTSTRSGRQLREITQAALNRRNKIRVPHEPRKTVLFDENILGSTELATTPDSSSSKKRKAPLTPPDSSPVQATPSKKARFHNELPDFQIVEDEDSLPKHFPKPIRRARGAHLNVLERSFGGLAISRGRKRDHCVHWVAQTANFHSAPEDIHKMQHLPFCSTSCNTNSIVAIGDEEGYVRLVDTARDSQSHFSDPHLVFQPHAGNAIMDLAFSSDDLLLATASGDQTAQVIDIRTQSPIFGLCRHTSSVRQICFQPGNDKVLATSSRDGTVQLWDLRCSGAGAGARPVLGNDVIYAATYNSINGAHANREVVPAAAGAVMSRDVPSKGETPSRRGDVSVTSLQFLPAEHGREHLLLTASDVSTTIKLWDIRARFSRRNLPVAIACTAPPESHNRHRQFGITSLVLSGDSSRLYALSRDNTVYAYSTSHLILGHAPELTAPASRHRHNLNEKQGLGPLYGFRHAKFHATTFYVKAALRKAKGDKPEMLAVGSGDGCPVLFPTDETLLRRNRPEEDDSEDGLPQPPSSPLASSPSLSSRRPLIRRMTSNAAFSSSMPARLQDTVPIYSHGTPLIRGHEREVTNVCWSQGGELVSVGDDFIGRCWREEDSFTELGGAVESSASVRLNARELRMAGEGGGKRWACGWADLGDQADWDEDDG